MQLFSLVIPLLLDLLLIAVETAFGAGFIYRSLSASLAAVAMLSKAVGFVLMSALYGWYAFDPFWCVASIQMTNITYLLPFLRRCFCCVELCFVGCDVSFYLANLYTSV